MGMIIDGKSVDSSDKKTLDVINPANNKVVGSIPLATSADIDKAVVCAKKAQKEWEKVPLYKRAEMLYKFLDLVDSEKESLAKLLMSETGKPITQARAEIGNIRIGFSAFIERAKHLYGDVIMPGREAGQDKNLQICVRQPLGVVLCIIPFNFPCDLFDQKVAPSLIMGNSAVIYPSAQNPLTLIRLVELMQKIGMPSGTLQIVTGNGGEVGGKLTAHPGFSLITFTGSTKIGIEAMSNASKNLTHVALELGGNDAFIVCEDADIDLAVEEMIWGRMYNTGQVCCASKRFIVHKSIAKQFAEKCVERLKKEKMGDPAKEDSTIGCLISEQAAIGAEEQIKKTVEQGGKILCGGKRNGAFLEPTVIACVPKTADVASDLEIFAPVVPIIEFDSVDEAVAIANSSKFGLSGCVFSKDSKTAFNVASRLECGGVVINGASFFRSFEMPFGGYKFSGIGTEGVSSTLEEVTHLKTIVLKNIF